MLTVACSRARAPFKRASKQVAVRAARAKAAKIGIKAGGCVFRTANKTRRASSKDVERPLLIDDDTKPPPPPLARARAR